MAYTHKIMVPVCPLLREDITIAAEMVSRSSASWAREVIQDQLDVDEPLPRSSVYMDEETERKSTSIVVPMTRRMHQEVSARALREERALAAWVRQAIMLRLDRQKK